MIKYFMDLMFLNEIKPKSDPSRFIYKLARLNSHRFVNHGFNHGVQRRMISVVNFFRMF